MSRRFAVCTLVLITATLVAACSDNPEAHETPTPQGGDLTGGGGSGTTGGHGGEGATGGIGGIGGTGGEGGAPPVACGAGCPSNLPICVDETFCADVCPSGRDSCNSEADSGPACCGAGMQCCETTVFGYTGLDLCRPDDEACPIGCPDGASACPLGEYCQQDIATGEYVCIEECPVASLCGQNKCCPFGAQCIEGDCKLPDLAIDAQLLADTVSFSQIDAASDLCLQGEGCLSGDGVRNIVNFSTRTMNVGEADFVIGIPSGPDFEYDDCHQHFHYFAYADYRLFDADNAMVTVGHKQGFAVIDIGPVDPEDPNTAPFPKYDGEFQGIQRGWYDEYSAGLACQWIDVTGLAAGEYTLEVEINPARKIGETDLTNNVASIQITIPDPECFVDCSHLNSPCTKGVCVVGEGCTVELLTDGEICEDGNFCTEGETCLAGECVGGSEANEGDECEDGEACTFGETCQAGVCTGATPVPDGDGCWDGLNCTDVDTCQNGVCVGQSIACPSTDCQVGTCSEELGCVSEPATDGQPCDDQSTCTTATTCTGGVCGTGTPTDEGEDCDDDRSCTSNTTCTAGVCSGGDGPNVFFQDAFADNSQAWTLGNEWEIGSATAGPGFDPGQDHTAATSDNGVAGVVLGGIAALEKHSWSYLESPVFDTSGASGNVILSYYRWLNSDSPPWMSNDIEVWDGTSWVTIWLEGLVFDSPTQGGNGWVYQEFDLTAYKNDAMKIRFGFIVEQAEGLYEIGSWNVDDVLVADTGCE